jgi:hypothetical protein
VFPQLITLKTEAAYTSIHLTTWHHIPKYTLYHNWHTNHYIHVTFARSLEPTTHPGSLEPCTLATAQHTPGISGALHSRHYPTHTWDLYSPSLSLLPTTHPGFLEPSTLATVHNTPGISGALHSRYCPQHTGDLPLVPKCVKRPVESQSPKFWESLSTVQFQPIRNPKM